MIWKNKKIWIILFSCAASASALAVFVILPLRERVYSKKDEMVKKQLMAEHLRKESTRAGEYKKDLAFLKENKEKIDEVFITEGEEIRLIQELENLAEAQGLSISINSLDKKNKKKEDSQEGYESVFLKINIKGTFQNYMDYLYKLENINRLVKLDSVELDKYSLEERKEGDTIDFDTGGELVRSEIMLSFLMKKDENK